MERVAITMCQEEVQARVSQLLRRRMGCVWRVEYPPRGNPPARIALRVNVSAFILEHIVGDAAAVNQRDQTRCEGKLVAFKVQRQRLQFAEGQGTGKVVSTIVGAHMFDNALLY